MNQNEIAALIAVLVLFTFGFTACIFVDKSNRFWWHEFFIKDLRSMNTAEFIEWFWGAKLKWWQKLRYHLYDLTLKMRQK